MKEEDIKVVKIGDVALDNDKASILRLNTNSAVLSRSEEKLQKERS